MKMGPVKVNETVVSGIMMGISGLFAKMAMLEIPIDITLLADFLQNPYSWLSGAFGIVAFVYLQKALYRSRISYVVPTAIAFSIITPIVLSVVLLGEYVSFLRWIGVGLITMGVIGLARDEAREDMLRIITRNVRSLFSFLGGIFR